MNIGIIASSNGSVFTEIFRLVEKVTDSQFKFFVVLDRQTALLDFCKKNDINHRIIKSKDNKDFCFAAREYLKDNQVDIVILFFLRMVSSDIYDSFFTVNLHPSVLPAYKGLNVIKKTISDKHKYLGATLHVVNEVLDGGEILMQTTKVIDTYDLRKLEKTSFLQKTMLMFIFFDYIVNERFVPMGQEKFIDFHNTETTAPFFITNKFKDAFKEIENREGCWLL